MLCGYKYDGNNSAYRKVSNAYADASVEKQRRNNTINI